MMIFLFFEKNYIFNVFNIYLYIFVLCFWKAMEVVTIPI